MNHYNNSQGNNMNENQEEFDSSLMETCQQLLRDNSLLTNFASLVGEPSMAASEESKQEEQQQQQQQQQPLLQYQSQVTSNNSMMSMMPLNNVPFESVWTNLDNTEQSSELNTHSLQHQPVLGENDNIASCTADNSASRAMPSLQTWAGQYNFQISLSPENKDRNKWCYSPFQNKLYLCTMTAVPIQVKVSEWISGSITITPVFKASTHRLDSVAPCFNCKNNVKDDMKDYIVQVEGQQCEYKEVDGRYLVSLPLCSPPPGEEFSTLLVKLVCLTSCVGGPNRRPFCLVFALNDKFGNVIGRQVLDVKCCRCPFRDMTNENSTTQNQRQPTRSGTENPVQNRVPAPKRSAPVPGSSDKKRFIIKLEPGTERRYKLLPIPEEYVSQVKVYVNNLASGDFLRRNNLGVLPFPEED